MQDDDALKGREVQRFSHLFDIQPGLLHGSCRQCLATPDTMFRSIKYVSKIRERSPKISM